MSKRFDPYRLKKPCANCPFLKDAAKAIRLHPDRVPSIIEDLLSGKTTGFSCHKTLAGEYIEDDEGDERYVAGDGELQCAGALAVLEKLGRQTQLMQIMQRMGAYNPDDLIPIHDLVIDYQPKGESNE